MKTKLTLVFLLFFITLNAQITDLKKLSNGKFYDSDVIKDINNNIKGYFLLFETDKIEKETYNLEYVVLDENLQKVTNGFITEMKYESFLITSKKINVDVTLNNEKLLLRLSDDINAGMSSEAYVRFRILDLKTNKLTDIFTFNKNELKLNPKIDRKVSNYSENFSQYMYFFNNVGLVVDSKEKDSKTKIEDRYLAAYDDNFKEIWKFNYDKSENKSNKKELKYLKSDENVLVFFNHTLNKNYSFLNDYSILFLDAKTGKLNKEFVFPDMDKYAYKIVDCYINENDITILGNYSKKSTYGNIDDMQNYGLFNFMFAKNTGKLIQSKYLNWEETNNKLDINKNGLIKKEGYLFIHQMLPLNDNRIIVVCEAFQQSPITTNNMFFLELTKDFKLNQVFEIEKFKNKFPRTSAHSSDIKKYGLFDFIDYQSLEDDEFLFFLNDNEKNSRNRKKSTLYGIVSYSNGKFNKQTLNLKTEVSDIKAYPGKKGYIMLVENFDDINKSTEFRLEKINY